ncbi:Monothiol glutaredoxin-S7 [Morus notabilis]|uniref:Monothiol glutaredoxin-S7 n=1 Tax=Morus notabilis TaxID=981085 RepID=W9SVF9_9ROSA|nr:uncharacterized protein LOC21398218 [Morus notabilis]EXC29914.1 Monothiol glutaredoxin-S7 [Morus notabilis]
MQCLGAMDSVRVAPAASLSVSGAAPVGKQVNSTTPLHLRNSTGPLPGSSLICTLPNAFFFTPKLPSHRTTSFCCFSVLSPELKTTLDKVVTSHKVVLFMKGTKDFPQCGFSHTVVQILKSLNVPFETINILENELLRQGLKEYSSWPTFPQLYIDGEFFGGCDITVDAYESGELQELLEKAMCS